MNAEPSSKLAEVLGALAIELQARTDPAATLRGIVDASVDIVPGATLGGDHNQGQHKLAGHEGRSTTQTNPRSGHGESAGFSTGASGGAAGQQSTSQASATESDDGVEAPAHTAGTGRAEDKR